MESGPANVLSPRNRNVSSSTGLAKFNLTPKKPHLNTASDAYALKYEPPRRGGYNAEVERKASFHRARSVFDGSSVNGPEQKIEPPQKDETSPTRKPMASSPFRPTFAVERSIDPSENTRPSLQELSRNELLSQYASKQTKLVEIQKQKELLEFEVLEIRAQLQKSIGQTTFIDSMYAKANTEVHTLKNKVSTLFQNTTDPRSLSKTASTIFTDSSKDMASFFSQKPPVQKASTIFDSGGSLRKTASSIFTPPAGLVASHDLKKKASAMLNHKFVNEVRDKLDQQQSEIEELTKKGTEFARSLFSSFSPKKEPRESALAESSFMVDNLGQAGEIDMFDRSVLLSEDDYEDSGSAIDIDDYESDEEKEN